MVAYKESHGHCIQDNDEKKFEEMGCVTRETRHPVRSEIKKYQTKGSAVKI